MEGMNYHLAVIAEDGRSWAGGEVYLRNMITALKVSKNGKKAKITVLYFPGRTLEQIQRSYPEADAFIEMPGGRGVINFLRKIKLNFCKLKTVNAVMGTFRPEFFKKIPFLCWIPDLQYVSMPELFSNSERIRQHELNRSRVQSAHMITVTSRTVLDDMRGCFPEGVLKTRLLEPVNLVPETVYEQDPAEIAQKYGLPEKFFHMPNQFWAHKNHEMVLEALSLLKKDHPDICVVCTGRPYEFRDPAFFNRLLTQVSLKGVRSQFVLLGHIPGKDMFALMRQSIALLQPSLFEGWSNSVEEARTLGKTAIVSDLPVHREKKIPGAVFFDPKNAKQLADILKELHLKKKFGPDLSMEKQARAELPERIEVFSEKFMGILNEIKK